MLEDLKELVCAANMALPRYLLAPFAWGNASGVDREGGRVVMKPSGFDFERLKPRDMIVMDLATGAIVEGKNVPSMDAPTHLELYKAFPEVGGIVHTHSLYATTWAQVCRPIPVLGTTHANDFCGEIPCTRPLRDDEIEGEYEKAIGRVIAEAFQGRSVIKIPAVLVASHGPFAWGPTALAAVRTAAVLEEVARMAYHSMTLAEGRLKPIKPLLTEMHYNRKHGICKKKEKGK